MKGAFEACYSVTFPASTCFQSHGSLWVLGRKPSTSSPRRPKIVHVTPALQSQNRPGRKQGLHLTDEEVKAQRGTGTCPRSSSKVKGYLEYFRKGRAQLPPRALEGQFTDTRGFKIAAFSFLNYLPRSRVHPAEGGWPTFTPLPPKSSFTKAKPVCLPLPLRAPQ